MLTRSHRRHKSNKHKSHKHMSKARQAGNKYYKLLVGTIVGMAGAESDVATINECIPAEWKIDDKTDPKPQTAENKTFLSTVIGVLEKLVTFICKFKDSIKSLFIKRLRRMNKKVFLQRYAKKKKGLWDDITGGISNATGAVVSGVGTVVGGVTSVVGTVTDAVAYGFVGTFNALGDGLTAIGDFATKTWNDVVDFGTKVVKDLMGFYIRLKQTIIDTVLGQAFVDKVTAIVGCISKSAKAAANIVKVINGLQQKITLLMAGGYAGLAKIFIDLICNFADFKRAINYLIDAIGTADVAEKYNKYGLFLGAFLSAIGKKKFAMLKKLKRRHKLRLN